MLWEPRGRASPTINPGDETRVVECLFPGNGPWDGVVVVAGDETDLHAPDTVDALWRYASAVWDRHRAAAGSVVRLRRDPRFWAFVLHVDPSSRSGTNVHRASPSVSSSLAEGSPSLSAKAGHALAGPPPALSRLAAGPPGAPRQSLPASTTPGPVAASDWRQVGRPATHAALGARGSRTRGAATRRWSWGQVTDRKGFWVALVLLVATLGTVAAVVLGGQQAPSVHSQSSGAGSTTASSGNAENARPSERAPAVDPPSVAPGGIATAPQPPLLPTFPGPLDRGRLTRAVAQIAKLSVLCPQLRRTLDAALGTRDLSTFAALAQRIAEWQREQGQVVDGIPGPGTVEALLGGKGHWARLCRRPIEQ